MLRDYKQVSFTLNKDNTSAVMIDGFDIEFNSNDNITGAYLQIKDTEGSIADGYYDIDLSKIGKKEQVVKNKKSLKPKQTTQKSSNGEDDIVVDVDFNTTLKAGTFCYVVCVYDAEGNISAPQEVCITIQSWGGNNDLAGVWNFTKYDGFDGVKIKTIAVGDYSCSEHILRCLGGSDLDYKSCKTINYNKYTINSDGTYTFEIDIAYEFLDLGISIVECRIAEMNWKDHYIIKGYWAYNDLKKEFITVALESTKTKDEGSGRTKIYDIGDARISLLKSNVSGNSLTLITEYLNSNGTVKAYYKEYFDKE